MNQIQTLKFSTNWNNKLGCKYFTTLRLSDKYKVGHTVLIEASKMDNFYAEIVNRRVIKMDMINEFIAGIDTGYTVDDTKDILKRMYPNVDWRRTPIYLYLLRRTKTDPESLFTGG
jgi:hypothetical protein